ncbi:hypothetical protein PHET_07304 [Paragonimus heterotremus]|uniref:Anaphase-promoting complex subunit 4 n=1 Tax=Paragonimus heterotremus TaxID=100268 RepID=A0A8J4WQ77_9TREM|nr:hypothetical protein PHET_07304 [Paragonimus heterotremus]
MVGEYSYCPVETKQHLKNKVALCSWSPKTDLIALGLCNGVISVHRYKMVCIWESPATSDPDDITQLVWRPDGKSLACAYRSGRVCLFLANDGFVYQELHFADAVTHLSWTTIDCIPEQTRNDGTNAATFFPDLNCLNTVESDSSLNSGSDMSKFSQLLSNLDGSLTILTIYSCNTLHFYGCDSFELARWHVKPSLFTEQDSKLELLGCRFSACQRYLLILYRWLNMNGETCLELQRIPCDGLVKLGAQVREISLLHSSIRICKELLDKSFGQICTSWEDTILEMDVKFTKYARERLSRNKNWSLCVELLEFILFGNCPASLRKFLVEDWTASSLKRTGTATLKAYESIKTICFQQLQLTLQRLLFHSSILLGKLRDTQRYEPFGISADSAVRLCSTVGSVLQKTQELHLVIEKSVTHLRGFFKWIYVAILKLSGRVLPDDFPQYIRPGEVRKPLELVVANSLKDNADRAKLRNLVNLSEEKLRTTAFPVGLFPYCSRATLADLIQKSLQNDIDSLFGPPTAGDFSRSCFAFEDTVSQLLYCGSTTQFDPTWAFYPLFPVSTTVDTKFRTSVSDTARRSTLFAWSPPRAVDGSADALVLMEFETGSLNLEISLKRTAAVRLDAFPNTLSSKDGSYRLQDFEFFTSELLILLLCRSTNERETVSDSYLPAGDVNTTSWIIMLPIQNILVSSEAIDLANSSTPLWTSAGTSPSLLSCHNLSELITPANMESLPWEAVKLATNGDRSIVFVLFKGRCLCRVYLLERPEPDDAGIVQDNLEEQRMETEAVETTA